MNILKKYPLGYISLIAEPSILRSRVLAVGILGLLFLLGPSDLSASGTSICDGIAGNLVMNCGFEGGVQSSTIGGHTNDNVPVEWTSNAGFDFNSNFNQRSTAEPNSGNFDLSIGNPDRQTHPTIPLATLSQTFTDTSGAMYAVTFYALTTGSGDPYAYLTVSVNGGSVSLNDSTSGNTWVSYTFTFTGTGSDTLTITGQTDPGEWLVDDVSVPGGPSPTPEPASFFLMGSGLLAMGGILRRRLLRR